MSDRHIEDGMGFAGHAPSREDHLERRQTQKIVALANENDRLRALNEELVGALDLILPLAKGYNAIQASARGGCPESNRRYVGHAETALARATGGSDG